MKQKIYLFILLFISIFSCSVKSKKQQPMQSVKTITAKEILGNPKYLAISYGGYRYNSRDKQPTIAELKEDLKIMHAMGIKLLRTYNVHLAHAKNVLQAIKELQQEDANFQMYVMLGAWIDCKNAWTEHPNHNEESQRNQKEIAQAVTLANAYSNIVKIIAVGNEAMVKWAHSYYVQPNVILKWVNHLQHLKQTHKLPKELWITSSDNFASWGGGSPEYHNPQLNQLIQAVDYISMHTYPMHDTHYHPVFWGNLSFEKKLTETQRIEIAMQRALDYAKAQYNSVEKYMKSLGVNKPIHIGETGWASFSNGFYGPNGSHATDEYKAALFYNKMRNWTNQKKIACFYFEAFDEPWKDAQNPGGSENHFGLFTVTGKAKFAIWDFVDKGVFKGLTRNGNAIVKTYKGNEEALKKEVKLPPLLKQYATAN